MNVLSSSDRYFSNHFGSLSAEQVAELEKTIGASLPKEYREFLLRENGGIPNEEGKDDFKIFFGIYDGPNDLALHWKETRGLLPDMMLPIGENFNEDYVLLDLTTGSVLMDGDQVSVGFDEFVRDHFVALANTSSPAELIDDHRFDELQELLDSGQLHIDDEAEFGMTLIQYSAFLKKTDAVEFLAQRGAKPDGCLHAMLESGFGDLQIIQCVLKHGADINELNDKGERIIDIDSPWVDEIIEQAGASNPAPAQQSKSEP